MKLSLRNIFGIITFVCIGLVIVRRPLAYAIDNFDGGSLAKAGFNFIAPWYFDLYLLGISDYVFDAEFQNTVSSKGSPGVLPFIGLVLGFIFYVISHMVGLILSCTFLTNYFFPVLPEKTESEIEKQEIPYIVEDYNFGGEIDD